MQNLAISAASSVLVVICGLIILRFEKHINGLMFAEPQ